MINDSNLDNVFTENDNQEAFDYKGEKGILSKVGFSYFFLLLIMFFIPQELLLLLSQPLCCTLLLSALGNFLQFHRYM